MNQNNDDKLIQMSDLGELTQKEIDLIFYLRYRWRYGEVTLVMHDGKVQKMVKTQEFLYPGK